MAAVLQCLKPLLDSFTEDNAKREVRSLCPEQFLHDLWAATAWMETGDKMWLSALGISLSKHPGFDGPRASRKGELSAYFSTIACAAKHGSDWDAAAEEPIDKSPMDAKTTKTPQLALEDKPKPNAVLEVARPDLLLLVQNLPSRHT